MRTLSELKSRGLNGTANALAQSADNIQGFFQMLRAELGFYIGCLNLRERLLAKGQPVCCPDPAGAARAPTGTSARASTTSAWPEHRAKAVGNDVDADGKR